MSERFRGEQRELREKKNRIMNEIGNDIYASYESEIEESLDFWLQASEHIKGMTAHVNALNALVREQAEKQGLEEAEEYFGSENYAERSGRLTQIQLEKLYRILGQALAARNEMEGVLRFDNKKIERESEVLRDQVVVKAEQRDYVEFVTKILKPAKEILSAAMNTAGKAKMSAEELRNVSQEVATQVDDVLKYWEFRPFGGSYEASFVMNDGGLQMVTWRTEDNGKKSVDSIHEFPR